MLDTRQEFGEIFEGSAASAFFHDGVHNRSAHVFYRQKPEADILSVRYEVAETFVYVGR